MQVTVPKIVVSADAHQKIQHWVKMAPGEISGLGIVEEIDGGYYIPEVFLLDQECTGSDTEIDPIAISKLQMQLMAKEDGLQDKLKFWWHSHVNMDVFWSGTDELCIRTCRGNRYLISIVYNKRREYRARIDYANNHTPVVIDKMDMIVAEPSIEDLFDIIFDDFSAENDVSDEVYDVSKKLFKLFKKNGLVSAKDIDLGWETFCKNEYKEKVKNKYSGHGGGRWWSPSRGSKKNGRGTSGGHVSPHQQRIPWDDEDDYVDHQMERGMLRLIGEDTDEFFDPMDIIFQVEPNLGEVTEFMHGVWCGEENWIEQ